MQLVYITCLKNNGNSKVSTKTNLKKKSISIFYGRTQEEKEKAVCKTPEVESVKIKPVARLASTENFDSRAAICKMRKDTLRL